MTLSSGLTTGSSRMLASPTGREPSPARLPQLVPPQALTPTAVPLPPHRQSRAPLRRCRAELAANDDHDAVAEWEPAAVPEAARVRALEAHRQRRAAEPPAVSC